MDELDVVLVQARAMQAAEKVSSVVPKRLLEKEEDLVEWYLRLKGNQRTKLVALYNFMVELYRPLSVLTPCKKGCSSCCHIPLSISEVEIEVIERGAGKKPRRTIGEPGNFHGQPCPFLINGACSIYAHRPFVCRRHIALTETNYWCDPDRCNSLVLVQPRFSEVEKVFQMIISEVELAKPVDIRQVFGVR